MVKCSCSLYIKRILTLTRYSELAAFATFRKLAVKIFLLLRTLRMPAGFLTGEAPTKGFRCNEKIIFGRLLRVIWMELIKTYYDSILPVLLLKSIKCVFVLKRIAWIFSLWILEPATRNSITGVNANAQFGGMRKVCKFVFILE